MNPTTDKSRSLVPGSTALLVGFALTKLLVHLITNALDGYGIFRDELYYLACSEHLDIGYVDQPPMAAWILAVSRFVLGDSLFAIRFLPALAGAATVFLVGLIAREFGGKAFAISLACVGSIVSLIFLSYDTVYSMNAFDVLFQTIALYLAVRLIVTENRRYWMLLGLVLGIGSLTKINALWLAAGIFIGFLMTKNTRGWFATLSPYIAGAMTFVLFLPYIVWNIRHDFATLEFIHNATTIKYASQTSLSFVLGQVLINNPVNIPIMLAGLYFLFFYPDGKKFRPLGIAFLTVFLVLVVNGHSKPEYLAPATGILLAAGGVAFERWSENRGLRWLKPVYLTILVLGVALVPFAMPILPIETYIAYQDALGASPSTAEGHQLNKLPQFYADMFGWEEQVRAVAAVYNTLSLDERARCAIFGDNYGRCGAIDFFGGKYGLPKSIGRQNNYWIWGPRQYTGDIVIIIGGDIEDQQRGFERVEIAGKITNEYCMPYENNLNIFVCRKIKTPIREVWRGLRDYI